MASLSTLIEDKAEDKIAFEQSKNVESESHCGSIATQTNDESTGSNKAMSSNLSESESDLETQSNLEIYPPQVKGTATVVISLASPEDCPLITEAELLALFAQEESAKTSLPAGTPEQVPQDLNVSDQTTTASDVPLEHDLLLASSSKVHGMLCFVIVFCVICMI